MIYDMHELSIAAEIISVVEQQASQLKLDGIKAVGIRLGALAGIDPEALSFGFEAGISDTPLEGARLLIEWLPVKGRCGFCHKDFEVNENIYACPYCFSRDLEITQGEEMEITHLETE